MQVGCLPGRMNSFETALLKHYNNTWIDNSVCYLYSWVHTYSSKQIITYFQLVLLWSLQRQMGPHLKWGLDVKTHDSSHAREGIKRFVTYVIEVSQERRGDLWVRFAAGCNCDWGLGLGASACQSRRREHTDCPTTGPGVGIGEDGGVRLRSCSSSVAVELKHQLSPGTGSSPLNPLGLQLIHPQVLGLAGLHFNTTFQK